MRGRHRGLVLDGGAHDDRVHRAHGGGGGPDRAIDASAAAIGSRLRARSGVNEKKTIPRPISPVCEHARARAPPEHEGPVSTVDGA